MTDPFTPDVFADGTGGGTPITAAKLNKLGNAVDALAVQNTKGDLLAHNGTAPVRVPAGTTNYALTPDATQTAGVKWARRAWFTPEEFGAVGDGSTDDGPAFTAAYTAAAAYAVAAGGALRTVIAGVPGKPYRIKTTIIVADRVLLRDCFLVGPITSAAAINSGNNPAVPTATDVSGQTAGACFTDAAGATGAVYSLMWDNCHLQAFRYGMVSLCLAWNAPVFRDVIWENCNIGFFAYQGAQEPRFFGSGSLGGAAGTTFVAAATCFAAGHPFTGADNFFADDLIYEGNGQLRDKAVRNATFDAWFIAAILRPTTASITAGGSHTFAWTDTVAQSVSGRNIYAPSRNVRGQYGWFIHRTTPTAGDFGLALIGDPFFLTISDITGEYLFPSGPQALITILLNSSTGGVATFDSIDATAVTNPATAAVAVVTAPGVSSSTASFYGRRITGGVIGGQYFAELEPAISRETQVIGRPGHWLTTPNSGKGSFDIGTTFCYLSSRVLPAGLHLDQIAAWVTVAGGTGATVRLGVYADDGTGIPLGNVLVNAGAVATTATGIAALTINYTTPRAGRYWFIVRGEVATCSLRSVFPVGEFATDSTSVFGASPVGLTGYLGGVSAGAYPTTLPGVYTPTTYAAQVAVRVGS